ncbi:CHAT domain-containing protein [Herbihabitans rhizosphaerae]|uniref:CHAT domain-containing protein n=1 Tax=Herbihabitans rhizosphaerae TaxID=1872711 RepID=A0A4Q7L5P2_9PSEU|nr:CHAT domain-containing protein [Herbihabitans rhizosphaerae]RZS44647.1 CHAT domain-containing protein [Herbihabitans rhizosphaerae]
MTALAAENFATAAVRDPVDTVRALVVLLHGRGIDRRSRALAWHAVARARIECGQQDLAYAAARRAFRAAERAGLTELAGEGLLLLAWIQQDRGHRESSRRYLSLAWPRVGGGLLARARCLRGLDLCVAGEHTDAVRELSTSIMGLRRAGDTHWLANALNGRGIARACQRRLAAADADFAVARDLFVVIGEGERAATCTHNRGWVAALGGDLPTALARYDEAVRAGMTGARRPETLVDRALALLSAGLADDAAVVLADAERLFDGSGRGTMLAEALLALGQCASRASDHRRALDAVRRARALFRRQRRVPLVAAATAVELRVLLRDNDSLLPVAVAAARRCDRLGRPMEAAELRLAAAASAGPAEARRLLRAVERERQAGPVRQRVLGWLARARRAALDGDRRAVFAACRAGLRVVDEHVAAMGAVELQASAAELGGELAAVGLAAAMDGGRPRTVLRWIERYRGAVSRRRPVRPPADPALAAELVRLRAESDGPRLSTVEGRVRRLSLASSAAVVEAIALPSLDEVAARLGSSVLVSLAVHNGRLVACTVAGGRVRLHRLGAVAEIGARVDGLRFALGVHARTGRESARVAARAAADELDRAILSPLDDVLGDRPLVIVPVGELRALPWAALRSCAGRPVTVTPSVASWLTAPRVDATGGHLWIAGPGLPHAAVEVAGLHRRWGGILLRANESRVADVLAAVDGADVVHVAAHGRFREDAPMFSCLDLADGPLYGYDLDSLPRAPKLVVLSACEAGRSATGGLIGLATVLLRRGAGTVIASTLPVPDAEATPLVTALHDELGRGATPAEALAAAQTRHGHLGFACFT